MKLINRYHLWASLECQCFSKAEAVLKFSAEEDGVWVQYQDYANLQSENERLASTSTNADRFLISGLEQEVAILKAEVERLRKAGDAMVLKVPVMMACLVKAEEAIELMNNWISAKDGKPSV